MSTSHIYPLTKRPQLIDLNGENVNFKLNFQVKALDPLHEFKAIVLTQEQLDSIDLNKIEMKHAKGSIQGNITANNDKYQNYFLVLKKNETENNPDFNVEVVIDLEKVESAKNDVSNEMSLENVLETQPEINESNVELPKPFYKKPIFWLVIAVIIILISYYLYQFYIKKQPVLWFKPKTNVLSSSPVVPAIPAVPAVPAVPVVPVVPAVPAVPVVDKNPTENQLYNNLSKL